MNRAKILGIYQIVGGLIGVLMTLYFISRFKPFVIFLFISILSFSVYCGYLLFKNQSQKAFDYSIINQFIQIMSFSVFGCTYKFYSGIFLCFGLNVTRDTIFIFDFGITTLDFKINSSPDLAQISINLIPIILINILFNLKDKSNL